MKIMVTVHRGEFRGHRGDFSMVTVSADVMDKARQFLLLLKEQDIHVIAAYLFGSYAKGTFHRSTGTNHVPEGLPSLKCVICPSTNW